VLVPTKGKADHDKYEGVIRGQRRTVPVSRSHDEFFSWLLESMIRQSGLSKKEFYGLTKATAKKYNCPFMKNGLPASVRA